MSKVVPKGNYAMEKISERPEYKKNNDRLKKAHESSSKRRHNPDELIELMHYCLGNMSAAARICDVHRMTFYRWLKKDGSLSIIREMDEIWNDRAEEVLNEHVDGGDLDAAKFRLKTKAKDRGYTERTEVDTRIVIEVKIEE